MVETEVEFDARPLNKKARPKIPRGWRFDVALPQVQMDSYYKHTKDGGLICCRTIGKLAIEVEGLGHGRHQRHAGFVEDVRKYLEAFAQGWTVVRITWQMIGDGTAMEALARAGVRIAPLTKDISSSIK